MTTINVGDIVQVIQTWDAPLSSVAQNVWHLKMVSGAGADSADILAAILAQQQVGFAEVEDFVADDFNVESFELRLWDAVLNRFDGVGVLASSNVGGVSIADYEPHGVAMLGRIITETARRQGRTFVPGAAETSIVAGVLTGTVETALAAYLAIFDTDISVTGGLLSWCTFNTDPLSPVFETASLAIQSVIANSLPSYIGKRKPGVGL